MILATLLVSIGLLAHAETIVITKETPRITPIEYTYAFPPIDWEGIEKRQDAGKANEDYITMMCDDTCLALVEIKLPDGLEKDITIQSDDCNLKGADHSSWGPAWLHFEGPKNTSECTIQISKKREGKKPLVMQYFLSDAC